MKYSLYIFLVASFFAKAQERLGISNSNYSSTNSIFLNPSSSVDSRTYMQLNLVGANAYGMNNIGYLPKFSAWKLWKAQALDDPQVSQIKLNKFLYAYGSLEGPAFVMSKRNYGVGVFARGRTVVDMKGTPFKLTKILLKQEDPNAPPEDDINLKNVKVSSMSWAEFGGNVGYMISRDRDNLVTLGANLKYITGINIIYANLTRLKGAYSDTAIDVQLISGKLRYNDIAWNTGRGAGMDLGITYKKMLGPVETYLAHSTKSNCTYVDYRYKVALSLRDLGYIRFRKNTTKTDIGGTGYFYTDRDDTSYVRIFQNQFKTSYSNDPILATLPTNLSLQADYNFGYHVYLNATIVKSIMPSRVTGVQSPNLVSICPRYEFRQFEVAMPLTFQRFIYPQLGLAARYRTFVLGVDNVFPLFMRKNTYGAGVYFSLGISLFRNPACAPRKLRIADCPTDIKKKDGKQKGKRKLFGRRKKSPV